MSRTNSERMGRTPQAPSKDEEVTVDELRGQAEEAVGKYLNLVGGNPDWGTDLITRLSGLHVSTVLSTVRYVGEQDEPPGSSYRPFDEREFRALWGGVKELLGQRADVIEDNRKVMAEYSPDINKGDLIEMVHGKVIDALRKVHGDKINIVMDQQGSVTGLSSQFEQGKRS